MLADDAMDCAFQLVMSHIFVSHAAVILCIYIPAWMSRPPLPPELEGVRLENRLTFRSCTAWSCTPQYIMCGALAVYVSLLGATVLVNYGSMPAATSPHGCLIVVSYFFLLLNLTVSTAVLHGAELRPGAPSDLQFAVDQYGAHKSRKSKDENYQQPPRGDDSRDDPQLVIPSHHPSWRQQPEGSQPPSRPASIRKGITEGRVKSNKRVSFQCPLTSTTARKTTSDDHQPAADDCMQHEITVVPNQEQTKDKPTSACLPANPEVASPLPVLPAGSIEILSVDDDRIHHRVVNKILSRTGMRLVTALSAESCLKILEERYIQAGSACDTFPTMILMDIHLPGASGYSVIREIRSRYPNAALPIIMLSGSNDANCIAESLKAGANDFISKPFSADNLIARIGVQKRGLEFQNTQLALQRDQLLLKKMLPEPVIQRLNSGERCIFEGLDEVSIVFSDIVGFTNLTSSVHTESVIRMLDSLFKQFDRLTDKHGVYKVETIGDAYMGVAGHEASSQHDHALRVLNMAADMVKAANGITMPNGQPLQIRVGAHSGPAYAGVVGEKMPRYCLFGDTVNTASRMESYGFKQCVHISDAAYRCYTNQAGAENIGDPFKFLLMGHRDIKGKGLMQTWLVKDVGEAAVEHADFVELHKVSRGSGELAGPRLLPWAADSAAVAGSHARHGKTVKRRATTEAITASDQVPQA